MNGAEKKRSFFKDAAYNIKRTMELDPAAHSKLEVFWLYPHIKALGFSSYSTLVLG